MTEKNEPERQKAELLWRYIEELKQAENPEEVQFVAITRGECAEAVGLMETAAEAYVLTRKQTAPHCRREAIRQRLQAAMAVAPAAQPVHPAASAAPRAPALPAWLAAPLTTRWAGWVVAFGLALFFGLVVPRSSAPASVVPMGHAAAVAAIPKLVNGTLSEEQSRALLAHLIRCNGCMELYLKLKATRPSANHARQSRLPLEAPATGRPGGLRVAPRAAGYSRVASAAWGR